MSLILRFARRVHPVKTSKAQLRSLIARGQRLQEEDRARVADDLHDDVCQKLTALSIDLSLLRRRLGEEHPEGPKIDEILGLVGRINQSVRKVMNDLRPKVLDEFGIIAALKYECPRLEKAIGREVKLKTSLEDVPMPTRSAQQTFRLVQQMLHHFAKHPETTRLAVEAHVRDSILVLQVVSRTGRSKPSAPSSDEVLNIVSMEETAARLGGTFAMERAQSHQALTLSLPIGRNKSATKDRGD